MISDNSQSEEDGAGKVKPSTSCRGHRSARVTWIPTPEKETYRTVVVNYRYAKMDKNYPRNTAAVSKKKHWSRMISAMSAKRNSNNDEFDDDDVPNLRKLYQSSHEELESELCAPSTPTPSCESFSKTLTQEPNTEFVKLEAFCMPMSQEAIVEDPMLKTLKEIEIESECCAMPKSKPKLELELELEQDIDLDAECSEHLTPEPEPEPYDELGSEPEVLLEDEPEHEPEIDQETEAEIELISIPKLESGTETGTGTEPEADEDIEFNNACKMPPSPPSTLYPKVIVLTENEDDDDDSDTRCPRKKIKLDDTFQTSTSGNSTKSTQSPERPHERKHSSSKSKVRIQGTSSENNVKQRTSGKETSTGNGTQQQLRVKQTQGGIKQRQLELHRYRIAVEQKRLELLEVKLARERDEMLREQILFEKELELKSSQMKELIDDKKLDIM